MAVGKSSDQPLNCCHCASCILCTESEALVIHERAMSWHRAGSSHFSLWDTFLGCRSYHAGNGRLGGLTTYPPGGSAAPGGCSSTKVLARCLGGAQQQERSLPAPSPATPADGLGSVAQAPGRERCITSSVFCLASLFPHFFLSFSPLLFLAFIKSQKNVQRAAPHQCQCFVVWTSRAHWKEDGFGLALVLLRFAAINTWSWWPGTSAKGRWAWWAGALAELPSWVTAELPRPAAGALCSHRSEAVGHS